MFKFSTVSIIALLAATTAHSNTLQINLTADVDQTVLAMPTVTNDMFAQAAFDILTDQAWMPENVLLGDGASQSEGTANVTVSFDALVLDQNLASGDYDWTGEPEFEGFSLGSSNNVSTATVVSGGVEVANVTANFSTVVVANDIPVLEVFETVPDFFLEFPIGPNDGIFEGPQIGSDDVVFIPEGPLMDVVAVEISAGSGQVGTVYFAGDGSWFDRAAGDPTQGLNFEEVVLTAVEAINFGDDYIEEVFGFGSGTVSIADFGAADGTSETEPLLPGAVEEETGGFTFQLPSVDPNDFIFIDPEIAVGYTYTVDTGVFTDIQAPSLEVVDDPDGYTVTLSDGTVFTLLPGEQVDLTTLATPGAAITEFTLTGIDEDLMIDPGDFVTFVLGVKVDAMGAVNLTQTPIIIDTDAMSPVPVPTSAALAVTGLAAFGALRRRKKTAKA